MESCRLRKWKIGTYICDGGLVMHLPESSEDQPSRIKHQGRQPLITGHNTMFKSCSGIQLQHSSHAKCSSELGSHLSTAVWGLSSTTFTHLHHLFGWAVGQQLNINSNVLSKAFNLLQKLDTSQGRSQLQTFVAATLWITAMGHNHNWSPDISDSLERAAEPWELPWAKWCKGCEWPLVAERNYDASVRSARTTGGQPSCFAKAWLRLSRNWAHILSCSKDGIS
jgi:hypothetical protein